MSGLAKYLSLAAPIATMLTVLTGLVFGILSVRQWHRTRALTATVELVRTIQTPEFARCLQRIFELPPNAEPRRVLEDPETLAAAFVVSHAFESLGVLVFYRLLPLHLVDHLIGGSVRVGWQRLRPYFEDRRLAVGVMFGEWFQWLAEHMEERPVPGKERGAAEAHRTWKP